MLPLTNGNGGIWFLKASAAVGVLRGECECEFTPSSGWKVGTGMAGLRGERRHIEGFGQAMPLLSRISSQIVSLPVFSRQGWTWESYREGHVGRRTRQRS